MLKWYVCVAHMEDDRWPKQTMTWSLEGRWRGRPEVKWVKEFERVKKHGILTSKDTVNQQLWQLNTSNWWVTVKQIGS